MGASPYVYFVPYQSDFQQALNELREREFEAGRYYPAMFMPPPIVDERATEGPGAQHASIEEAMDAAESEETQSTLDIEFVGDEPGFGVARRLTDEDLDDYFETAKPTTAQVRNDHAMLNNVERGEAVCFPTYGARGRPAAICFAGYSCD